MSPPGQSPCPKTETCFDDDADNGEQKAAPPPQSECPKRDSGDDHAANGEEKAVNREYSKPVDLAEFADGTDPSWAFLAKLADNWQGRGSLRNNIIWHLSQHRPSK